MNKVEIQYYELLNEKAKTMIVSGTSIETGEELKGYLVPALYNDCKHCAFSVNGDCTTEESCPNEQTYFKYYICQYLSADLEAMVISEEEVDIKTVIMEGLL